MNKQGKTLLGVVLMTGYILSGCWDKIEMDNRGYVTGMGLDKFDYAAYVQEREEAGKAVELTDSPQNRYRITYSIPNLAAIAGEGSGEPKYVKRSVDTTVLSVPHMIDSRVSNKLYFGHTKAIIFGKELLEDRILFSQALDALERNPEIARNIVILATEDTAAEVLEVNPEEEALVGIYVSKFFENSVAGVSTVFRQDIGKFLMELHQQGAALMPRITPGEKDIKLAGAAIIKDYTLQGWLGEREVGAYRWVKGEIEGAQITQLYRNIYIPYSVSEASTKIRFERKENTLHCVIKIDTEGEVLEYSAIEDQRLFDRENIRRLEKGFAEAIEEEVKNIVQKMQTEFRIDIFGWERELKKRHYELWKQYQGNWEETYENLPVTVEANVHIRRIGGIK